MPDRRQGSGVPGRRRSATNRHVSAILIAQHARGYVLLTLAFDRLSDLLTASPSSPPWRPCLSWRLTTGAMVVALAALALRPQLLVDGPQVGVGWGLHQSLLVLALLVNAWAHGVRRSINWPILALAAVLALNLLLGDLEPKLGLASMVEGFAILALPWTFTQVVLAPGSRHVCALVIASLPLLSVALGALLQAAGLGAFYTHRLEGATGNAAVFALLAFTGFAVAMHEATRPGQRWASLLAAINLALVVLSGTRMAILVSGLLLVVYVLISSSLRAQWRQRRTELLLGGAVVVAALAWYWPTLSWRLYSVKQGSLRLSNRDQIWAFYYDQLLQSPLFGRGLGAGFAAAADRLDVILPTPHNEYLHLLVVGGVVGFVACMVAIALWFRQLLKMAPSDDRRFLIALLPALAVYAITDNVLIYPTGLALFAYLGVLLTPSAPRPA
jgi:teichuronic acid biosynthesis protein TuaE